MVAIDDRYIDYDFTKDPRFVRGDLGFGMELFGSSRFYEDVVPVIPRNEWQGIIEKIEAENAGIEYLVSRIYDQSNEGSCVANAFSQAHEMLQAVQFGLQNVTHLSAMSLYKRIGTSPQSGAMVSDGIAELVRGGVLPLDNATNRARFGNLVMPNTGWRTPYPSGWEAVAKQFSGAEYYIVRSVEGLVTAGLLGHPVVVGRAGHSICYSRATFKSGKLLMPYPNSWSEDWGSAFGNMRGGFGFDSESYIRQSASWAVAIRSVKVPNHLAISA